MQRREFLLALLSATAAATIPVHAQVQSTEPSAADLLDALKSRATRSAGPAASPAADLESLQRLDELKQRVQRGLSVTVEELQAVEPVVEKSAFVDIEILFAFNSAEIKPGSDPLLASLATALKAPELARSDIMIVGHTDAKGRRTVNKVMSERRARAVRDALVKRHGITPNRLIPVGYGSEKLKVVSDPFAALNRRVQIVNLVR